MLKVWLIVYHGTLVGGSWGPLPYDMEACLRVAADQNADWTARVDRGVDKDGNALTAEQIGKARQIRFACVETEERPEITYDGSGPSGAE
jgi:hypothetical protein